MQLFYQTYNQHKVHFYLRSEQMLVCVLFLDILRNYNDDVVDRLNSNSVYLMQFNKNIDEMSRTSLAHKSDEGSSIDTRFSRAYFGCVRHNVNIPTQKPYSLQYTECLPNVLLVETQERLKSLKDIAWNEYRYPNKRYIEGQEDRQKTSCIPIYWTFNNWNPDNPFLFRWVIPHYVNLFKDLSEFVLARIIGTIPFLENHIVIREHFVMLAPKRQIENHIDDFPLMHTCHRIHIPIQTSTEVTFIVNGKNYNIENGQAFLLNTDMPHGVLNDSDQYRIHYIIDVIDKNKINLRDMPEYTWRLYFNEFLEIFHSHNPQYRIAR
jgi:hypothetical protein